MNQKQYERALEAVRNDCEGVQQLIDYHDRTCALGAMALAAGYDKITLRRIDAGRRDVNINGPYGGIAARYGLTRSQINSIYRANDAYYIQDERRVAVANVLHMIAASYNLELKPEGEESADNN